jgi:hypothetical protein
MGTIMSSHLRHLARVLAGKSPACEGVDDVVRVWMTCGEGVNVVRVWMGTIVSSHLRCWESECALRLPRQLQPHRPLRQLGCNPCGQ